MEQFREMLDYFGQVPIIVRSSSLLEDSFGDAFAGKYRSEFLANQGGPVERLDAFLGAVKLVYASALHPDAVMYRHRRGLHDKDEQMAVLVQRVSGEPHGGCYFPMLSGVAFSRNLYAWNERIDPARGVIRLVFGLGTRAVNRTGSDYPRMISVSQPLLRPEIGGEILKYSQHDADVLDLGANALVTRNASEILSSCDVPGRHLLVSVGRDGYVTDPVSRLVDIGPGGRDAVLTFNNLVGKTGFVDTLGRMLARIESAYGRPVDTEFTASVDDAARVRINLLQCRPMFMPGAAGPVVVPRNLTPERVLFRSRTFVGGGVVRNMRYVLWIDGDAYASLDESRKRSIGRIVGALNALRAFERNRVLVMGPGRWGSTNIALGVNVGYGDIHNASALVEIATEDHGHVPEVSYGTHFFQDLVEGQIPYVAVYPGDQDSLFNDRLLSRPKNVFLDLLPGGAGFEGVVHVTDVFRAASGAYLQLVVDPDGRTAVCYLE
jgi:hypothetical protein